MSRAVRPTIFNRSIMALSSVKEPPSACTMSAVASLQGEYLHRPRLSHRRERRLIDHLPSHHRHDVGVIHQKRRRGRHITPRDVNIELIGEVRCIDDGHSNTTVRVDVRAHEHFVRRARLGFDAYGARPSEAEVRCEGPQGGRRPSTCRIRGRLGRCRQWCLARSYSARPSSSVTDRSTCTEHHQCEQPVVSLTAKALRVCSAH